MPNHTGSPLTVTLIANPLMGHFTASYAVKAGNLAAFCSRFDFNMYSYESDLVLGCEIWRRKQMASKTPDFTFEDTLAPESILPRPISEEDEITSVLKARITQNFNIGLVWEGRFKQLLFSIGSNIDLKRKEQPFRAIGIEIQYNS